jgi:hypothetical protein
MLYDTQCVASSIPLNESHLGRKQDWVLAMFRKTIDCMIFVKNFLGLRVVHP